MKLFYVFERNGTFGSASVVTKTSDSDNTAKTITKILAEMMPQLFSLNLTQNSSNVCNNFSIDDNQDKQNLAKGKAIFAEIWGKFGTTTTTATACLPTPGIQSQPAYPITAHSCQIEFHSSCIAYIQR